MPTFPHKMWSFCLYGGSRFLTISKKAKNKSHRSDSSIICFIYSVCRLLSDGALPPWLHTSKSQTAASINQLFILPSLLPVSVSSFRPFPGSAASATVPNHKVYRPLSFLQALQPVFCYTPHRRSYHRRRLQA